MYVCVGAGDPHREGQAGGHPQTIVPASHMALQMQTCVDTSRQWGTARPAPQMETPPQSHQKGIQAKTAQVVHIPGPRGNPMHSVIYTGALDGEGGLDLPGLFQGDCHHL